MGSSQPLPEIVNGDLTLREYEMRILQSYLQKYNHNTKIVAEKLDIGVATVYRMLKEGKEKV